MALESLPALNNPRKENLDVEETIHIALRDLFPRHGAPFGVGKEGGFPSRHSIEALLIVISRSGRGEGSDAYGLLSVQSSEKIVIWKGLVVRRASLFHQVGVASEYLLPWAILDS